MSAPIRSVSTETLTVTEIVHKLKRNHFLIPTFQRDFVWQPRDVLSLWDSMYRAYPIGGILCWNTTELLEAHRRIGGLTLEPTTLQLPDVMEYHYILDGQQRLTSLYISYLAGRGMVEDVPFDFGLYFDPTASDDSSTDWKDGVFLFANDLNKRRDALLRRHVDPNLIVRVGDESALDPERLAAYTTMQGYSLEAGMRLNQLYRLLQLYRIPFISTQGVGAGDVCEIYERINQKGRELSTTDIVVARTFRGGAGGFSLRAMFDEIRASLSARAIRWRKVDQQTLLQMIGVCLRVDLDIHGHGARNPYGFDTNALLNLTPEAIAPHKEALQKAIVATIEFLVSQGFFSPNRMPTQNLAFPLCAYQYLAPQPNDLAMRQWLWRSAFDHESIDSVADVYSAIRDFFEPVRAGRKPAYKPLTLSIASFVRPYGHSHAYRQAMLAFLASLGPRDFVDGHIVTDSPVMTAAGSHATIHHICPRNFLYRAHDLKQARTPTRARGKVRADDPDSVMNQCWMSQKTNFDIGDKSPAAYFAEYRDRYENTAAQPPQDRPMEPSARQPHDAPADRPTFDEILASQLIPPAFANRTTFKRADYGEFLIARARLFADALRKALSDVPLTITGE